MPDGEGMPLREGPDFIQRQKEDPVFAPLYRWLAQVNGKVIDPHLDTRIPNSSYRETS